MGKTAFLFSGQGAQKIGMGKDLYENSDSVRKLFDSAEIIRPGTLSIMFDGDEDELKKTENTQPALYLTDLAAAISAEESGLKADAVAGFSLGEIPALAYAGAFDYITGFNIAVKRGEAMSNALNGDDTAMAAIVKLNDETVEKLCKNRKQVYPVNYNCDGQLVVSGLKKELMTLQSEVEKSGGRFVLLNVAGAFHSPFMNEASEKFGLELQKFEIVAPRITAYSNFTAAPYENDVTSLMTMQINHPVMWKKTIQSMIDNGFDTFVETGIGNVLQRLNMKISRNVKSKVFTLENK